MQTLVFYDEPQLALFRTDRGLDMLALAVEREGAQRAFFAREIREQTLERYLSGKFDLNFVLREAEYNKSYYFFDWSEMKGRTVPLTRAKFIDIENDEYYPDSGFFAPEHTHPYKLLKFENLTTQRFSIDGSWAAGDFSKFYGRAEALYSFYGALSESTESRLNRLVNSYYWRGGGSYVGFYGDLKARSHGHYPLEIEGIEYHSPGYIDVAGRGDILEHLSLVVARFRSDGASLHEAYRRLNGILGKEKLKSADKDAQFSSKGLADFAIKAATEFAKNMGLQKTEMIFAACNRNGVLYCKLILSFYRRAREFYLFHAEGRIQEAGPVDD